MTDATTPYTSASGVAGRMIDGLRGAQDWMDGHGRKAWLALTLAGLIFATPLGVALGIYAFATSRFSSSRARPDGWSAMPAVRCGHRKGRGRRYRQHASGNSAFDAYRAETLRRLEDEQAEFEAFLARLREARDKAEFDQFMADRDRRDDRAHDDADDRNDGPVVDGDALREPR